MTLRAGWARLCRAQRHLRERWFAERQIILREGDRVRALRLRSEFQMVAASLLVVGSLWSAWASIGYLSEHTRMTLAESEADRLRTAYDQVLDEISQQHSRVLDITQDLEHYRSYLLTLLEQNQNLRRDLRTFASQLDGTDGESQRTAAAEAALRGQLEGMAQELVGVSQRNETLQSDVAQLKSRLDGEDERARFAAARAALDRRIARLQEDAQGALGRNQELERLLTAKQQLVDQAQAARRQAVQDRDQMSAKLTDAEQRLQTMAQAHEEALNR